MNATDYLAAVNNLYRSGLATEHSYRSDLQRLLTFLCPGVNVTNEPQRIACGAPDYILSKKEIPVGYIEAKDVGANLESATFKEQFDRYRTSLGNLIITDYLTFRFYRSAELTETISIGKIQNGKIVPLPSEIEKFIALIENFVAWQGQTITSADGLASMMAGKARLMADVIARSVSSDEDNKANSELKSQLEAFRRILIHDLTPKSFSDLYSQTIAYGLFAARLHDDGSEDFTRLRASTLIPKSNPFLRKLFNNIGGPDLDTRIQWIVDDLIDIFRAADIKAILQNFSSGSGRDDAFTHFYEDFLAQYDPALRKSRGVWYTPDPAVRFIIRAVHKVLVSEFGLKMGLADASKVDIEVNTQIADKRSSTGYRREKVKVHRLQILDPATGTGTFLAQATFHIYRLFKGQEGIWPEYVEKNLIPRINGFEILMASYAVAHLKLDIALKDTGFDLGADTNGKESQRLRVFLSNTLEEAHPDTGTLFASWLSDEANQANTVKRETPVMAVIGNPPYSGISSNMSEWIGSLIEDYKYVDGTHFGEKKHWLHDDYVKFIRYGEYLIERTGEGVLAYINNHSFIDNPTFRGMRWHLLQTFDKVYIVNLHGNALKKEVAPDGSKDENVFDIQQGVSINIFVKKKPSSKRGKCKVYYADAWGSRDNKYDFLDRTGFGDLEFIEVNPIAPQYFFYPQDTSGLGDYNKGVSISDLFPFKTVACVTGKDSVNISWTSDEVAKKINFIMDNDDPAIRSKFGIRPKDARDWTVQTAKDDARKHFTQDCIMEFYYRPFDLRWTGYTGNSRGLYASPQKKVMQHLIGCDNIALIVNKQIRTKHAAHALVTKALTGYNILETANANPYILPLLLSLEAVGQHSPSERPYLVNINEQVAQSIAKSAGLTYNHSAQNPLVGGEDGQLSPIDILDYCYAVLHSNQYRTLYREYLNSDFPRIPLPHSQASMLQLVSVGSELRRLHLFDQSEDWELVTTYPIAGSNCVESKMTAKSPGWQDLGSSGGRVFINARQYFDGVTEEVWEFYVGAYQPAQKWLKDRAGKTLGYEEIRHYQLVIACIDKTIRLMADIDKIGVV